MLGFCDSVRIIDCRENPEDATSYRSEVDGLLNYLRSQDADSASIAALMLNAGITKSIELSVQLKRPVHEIENIKKVTAHPCRPEPSDSFLSNLTSPILCAIPGFPRPQWPPRKRRELQRCRWHQAPV